MLADFRSAAEILFLRWEDLRPEPVFSKSKDIYQYRIEASFSHCFHGRCIQVRGTRLCFKLFWSSCKIPVTSPVKRVHLPCTKGSSHQCAGLCIFYRRCNASSSQGCAVSRAVTAQQFRSTSECAKWLCWRRSRSWPSPGPRTDLA